MPDGPGPRPGESTLAQATEFLSEEGPARFKLQSVHMSRLGWLISILLISVAVFFGVVAETSSGPLGGLPYVYAAIALILAMFVIAISTVRTSRRRIREAERRFKS